MYRVSRKLNLGVFGAAGEMEVPPMTPADYVVDIPPEMSGKPILLSFHWHDAARPCDLGMSADGQELGLGFISMRLSGGEKNTSARFSSPFERDVSVAEKADDYR